MSLGATVKQTSRVIELVQDVEAIRVGLEHLDIGLELVSAQELTAEYGVACNDRNAYYRDYNNQNMSAFEIKERMLTAAQAPGENNAGFNASYVIRHKTDKDMFHVGLVEGENHKLRPVVDLYNTGRGLAQLLMSKNLFTVTDGHLHGSEYPDEAFERLAHAQVIGRLVLATESKGLVLDRIETEDKLCPVFAVRHSATQRINFTVERTGQMQVAGEGFEARACEEPINRLMSLIGKEMDDVVHIDDRSVERIRVPEAVTS